MGVVEKVVLFQPMVVLEHVVEVLLYSFYNNHDDSDYVEILSFVPWAHLFHDEGFVQIEKHQRIIKLQRF